MKTRKNILLLTLAVAGIFTLAANSKAADAVMSPKAKALEDSLRTVTGTTPDMIDRTVKPISPKAIALVESWRTVPSTPSAVASLGYRATGDDGITASPKARQRLSEGGSQFMIAPLK